MNDSQDRIEIFAIPAALLLALTLQSLFPMLSILSWLASLPIHECGHALLGNLSGQLSIPTPMYTVAMGPARNWFLILILATAFCAAIYYSLIKGLALSVFAFTILLSLQITLTFLLPKNITEAAILYAGQGAELIGSVILLLLFHASMPQRFNWKINRFLFLAIAALTFTKALKLWVGVSEDPSKLPFGAAIDFGLMSGGNSDGDLDRLIRVLGWSQPQIISVYVKTMWASLIMLILGWGTICYQKQHRNAQLLRGSISKISDN